MVTRGFTLLEVLIAIAILAIIVAMVYASFESVTRSVDFTRNAMAEVRARRFLARSFAENLGCVYIDDGYIQSVYQFLGADEEGPEGPADSIVFCSSSMALGGLSLPGDIKQVRYELLAGGTSNQLFDREDESREEQQEQLGYTLQAIETPLLAAMVGQDSEETDDSQYPSDTVTDVESPSWTLENVQSLDVSYYDGAEDMWRDEWDSMEMGRLPWSVRIRVNFARPKDAATPELYTGFDDAESPDFECIVPIRRGLGVRRRLQEYEPGLDPERANTREDADD